ncbi:hypothetical protein NECAME_18984, partial [Necator americanus]
MYFPCQLRLSISCFRVLGSPKKVFSCMEDHEIILDSSSDESIVGEQARKLFELCDKDEKGYIMK